MSKGRIGCNYTVLLVGHRDSADLRTGQLTCKLRTKPEDQLRSLPVGLCQYYSL